MSTARFEPATRPVREGACADHTAGTTAESSKDVQWGYVVPEPWPDETPSDGGQRARRSQFVERRIHGWDPPLPARPDPLGLLRALRRRWILATVTGLAVASVAASGAWFLQHTEYTAFALLRMPSIPPHLLFNRADGRGDFPTYQRTQAELIKTRYVLSAALERARFTQLSLARRRGDPVQWLQQAVQVDYPGGSELLRITLTGENPSDLALLVNAVTDAYREEIVQAEYAGRQTRLQELERTYRELWRRIRTKRSQLRELDRFANLQQEHADLQTQLRRARLRLAVEEDALRDEPSTKDLDIPGSLTDAQLDLDQWTMANSSETSDLQDLVARYKIVAVKKDEPSFVRARSRLEAAQSVQAARRSAIAEQLRAKVEREFAARLAEGRQQIAIMAEEEKLLAAEVNQCALEVERLAATGADRGLLEAEIANLESVAKAAGNELEALRVEQQTPPRVSLLQAADVPQAPNTGRRFKMAALAGVGAFCLVALCISYWEFGAGRIETADEVARDLGLGNCEVEQCKVAQNRSHHPTP